ncbi:hypothetical protein D3C84_957700 [compost metagenome]
MVLRAAQYCRVIAVVSPFLLVNLHARTDFVRGFLAVDAVVVLTIEHRVAGHWRLAQGPGLVVRLFAVIPANKPFVQVESLVNVGHINPFERGTGVAQCSVLRHRIRSILSCLMGRPGHGFAAKHLRRMGWVQLFGIDVARLAFTDPGLRGYRGH